MTKYSLFLKECNDCSFGQMEVSCSIGRLCAGKNNPVKFLIGVTLCSAILYLSECWGGRISDKNLTQESTFLSLLEPGDIVLADHGYVYSVGGHCSTRSETGNTSIHSWQESALQKDVEMSKQLSKVQIHVERVIGLVKNRYTILKGPMPVNNTKETLM